ncbi:MAG: hypothetical protein ACYC64_07075 [Armatimonadota bacterium]
MLRSAVIIMLAVVMLSFVAVYRADAEEWQWPDKLSIAGFNVTDVRGTVRPDGTGSATGTLPLGPIGNQKVSLVRSASGEITGSLSLTGKASGVDVQANLSLTGKGLEGKGTILSAAKPIVDASINISHDGQINGSGKIFLGGITIPATFTISGSFDVSGSAAAQKQVDTPLALYTFNGSLNLSANSRKVLVLANGQVQRTGKLANQVSSQDVSGIQVNTSDGQAIINVGGVDVTFKFF